MKPRFQVTYSIAGRSYWFTIPAPNANDLSVAGNQTRNQL